jgi:stage V sporulation protein SpoVS
MDTLLTLHSYFAYAVLGILLIAVLNALTGWFGKRSFTMAKDLRISLFALILSHLQLVIGLILFFVSANGLKAIQTLGMGGLNSASRLLAVEHPFINIVAIALITIGWSRHKRKEDDTAKFKSIAIFYGLGLLLILSRIPWAQWL